MSKTEVIDSDLRRIGHYRIRREIGAGAHGRVFLAHHQDRDDVPVALKVIENRGSLDRLMVEPEILSKLRHPGIVGLQEFFVEDGRLVVALEFLDGEDLKDYSEAHGPFTANETREFLRQMGSALQHAHAAGILHRDIKPANILVVEAESGPRYVLTDFGISRMAEGLQVVRHGGGTYQYMAPEQLRGRPTAQSDLWALGVVAYQMLTGNLPFVGVTVKDLAADVLYKTPEPLKEMSGDRPDSDVAKAIYGLLEKQSATRTSSAKALLEQLGGESDGHFALSYLRDKLKLTTDKSESRRLRRYTVGAVLAGLLWAGPLLLIPSAIALAGIMVFYSGQKKIFHRDFMSGRCFTLSGLALLILGWLCSTFGHYVVFAAFELEDDTVTVFMQLWTVNAYLIVLCSLTLIPLAAYLFSKRRSLLRQQSLRQALTESSGDTNRQLEILQAMAQERSTDMIVRQKYAESLLSHGQPKNAVVEAKLMLEEDPYNVAAGLLLAHGYFDLGLYDLTTGICDRFLAVAGYCFEFRELKDQAAQLAGAGL